MREVVRGTGRLGGDIFVNPKTPCLHQQLELPEAAHLKEEGFAQHNGRGDDHVDPSRAVVTGDGCRRPEAAKHCARHSRKHAWAFDQMVQCALPAANLAN